MSPLRNKLPTMVACRCPLMRKADVAGLIRQHTRKVCCIRDGGNDASIIQAADVGVLNLPQTSWNTDFTLTYFTGIGIVGKEGR